MANVTTGWCTVIPEIRRPTLRSCRLSEDEHCAPRKEQCRKTYPCIVDDRRKLILSLVMLKASARRVTLESRQSSELCTVNSIDSVKKTHGQGNYYLAAAEASPSISLTAVSTACACFSWHLRNKGVTMSTDIYGYVHFLSTFLKIQKYL